MTTSRVRQQLSDHSDDADLLLDSLRDIVGATYVLDPATVPGYVTDWTGRWESEALAVVRPGNTEEVAAVLAVCRRANVPIIPHGRITGLIGGKIPSEGSVVVSTRRINRSKGLSRREHAATRSHQSVPPLRQRVRADGGLATRHH